MDNYEKTDTRLLDNITDELLLYVIRQTALSSTEIKNILHEAISLSVYISAMGHPCRTPLGLLSIVLLPEDTEFSDVGIGSKLFYKERLVPHLFSEELAEFGYQHVSSGKMNRALRKVLSFPKCASKIRKANEASLSRWNYSKSF